MTRAERLLLALATALLLFSPVFLGGVGRFDRDWQGSAPGTLERFLWAEGPWAVQMVLGAAVAAAALVVARERAASGEPSPLRLHGGLLWPLLGLGALAVLHLVPLPASLHGMLSPGAAREREFLLPGDDDWRPLSVSPAGTRAFLGGWALGLSLLAGTLLVARRRAGAAVVAAAVVAAFAGSALYGLGTTFLGDDRVLLFDKKEHLGVTGPFLNRSSLAGGLSLALPLAAVLAAAAWGERGRRRWAVPAAAVLGAAAVVLAVTVPLTRSRGGLGAAAVALLALALLWAARLRWPARAKGALALGLVAVVAGGAMQVARTVPGLRERFETGAGGGEFLDIRVPVWAASVDLASRYPVLGTGPGTWEVAIHETQRAESSEELIHAHCEPLEFLAEGGLLGFVLAFLAAGGAAVTCLRAAVSEDPWTRALGRGCGAGLAGLLAGSLFEFHFHIPALGLAAAATAALPAAALAGEPRAVPSPVPGRGAFAAAGAVLLALVTLGAWQDSSGAALRGEAVRAFKGRDLAAWRERAERAVAADPDDAAGRRLLAGALLGDWSGSDLEARAALSLVQADAAVALEPFHAFSHWARVEALTAAGRYPEALDAIARARRRGRGIAHLHYSAGLLLFRLSAMDPTLLPPALDAFREAGLIVPQRFTDAWSLVEEEQPFPEVLVQLVPDRVAAWNQFAGWCARHGHRSWEVTARARAARRRPEDGALREACLSVAREAGLEDLALRVLAGEDQ